MKLQSNGANNIYIFKAEKPEIKTIRIEPVDGDYNKAVDKYIKENINTSFSGHSYYSQYPKPKYNSNQYDHSQTFDTEILNPPSDLIAVYFDGGKRENKYSATYTLEQLEKMGRGAKKMYKFYKKNIIFRFLNNN
ncbi:MAG: hypothetical protein U9532_03165 ['Conium maculatum' witches'-broom phytoplasma]|nr:hypothetical protein ['Conium maculatum' witches'-broom phytoplasma]